MKHFLLAMGASLLLVPSQARNHVIEYRLRLYHTHTSERLDIIYRRGDAYIPKALPQLDRFLRDHRTGEVHHFDPRLFDLLSDLVREAGHPDAEIDVVCGYRSPQSNEYLRRTTSGVAQH